MTTFRGLRTTPSNVAQKAYSTHALMLGLIWIALQYRSISAGSVCCWESGSLGNSRRSEKRVATRFDNHATLSTSMCQLHKGFDLTITSTFYPAYVLRLTYRFATVLW